MLCNNCHSYEKYTPCLFPFLPQKAQEDVWHWFRLNYFLFRLTLLSVALYFRLHLSPYFLVMDPAFFSSFLFLVKHHLRLDKCTFLLFSSNFIFLNFIFLNFLFELYLVKPYFLKITQGILKSIFRMETSFLMARILENLSRP